MAIKKQIFQIKGMQRDLSKSKFNPEYAYTIYNMRVMPTDTSTLYSLINEKGTREVTIVDSSNNPLTIQGTSLGQCVINDKLVVFTTKPGQAKPDYIYKLILRVPLNTAIPYFEGEILYNGNLGFNIENPIECLASYETEDILKVYWVDGINCPRVINISDTDTARSHRSLWNNTFFDFQPTIVRDGNNPTSLTVLRQSGGGLFPGGTILYCFTYSRKNGLESKIASITPIYYICDNDGAVGPDLTANTSYTIMLSGTIDHSFDYINVYSIIRTSFNSTPIVKLINKVNALRNPIIYFTDSNLYGTSIDPMELFYKGGEYFIASTLQNKDNTLFLGDVTVPYNIPSIEDLNLSATTIYLDTTLDGFVSNVINNYLNLLTATLNPITYLKRGNVYRLGFQLQDDKGNWTKPFFILDYSPTLFPKINYTSNKIQLPIVQFTLPGNKKQLLFNQGFKKIRPLVVYPSKLERGVIAQGIVAPTVYTPANRINNAPYALPSWFFRPYNDDLYYGKLVHFTDEGYSLERRLNHVVQSNTAYNGECQYIEDGSSKEYATLKRTENYSTVFGSDNRFFVDDSIITFHSPDLDDLSLEDLNNIKMRVIGFFFIDSSYGDVHIVASQGARTSGPNKQNVISERFSDLYTGISPFSGSTPWLDFNSSSQAKYFGVFPWLKTGSLNTKDDSTGVLQQKILSKFRQSQRFIYVASNVSYIPSTNFTLENGAVKLCREENEGLYTLNLQNPSRWYNFQLDELHYYNHVNLLISVTAHTPYADTFGGELNLVDSGSTFVTPIKYFSPTHIVISLPSTVIENNYVRQTILPLPYISRTGHGGIGHDGQAAYPEYTYEEDEETLTTNEHPFYLKTNIYDLPVNYIHEPSVELNDYYGDAEVGGDSAYIAHAEIMWIVELYRDIPTNIFGGTDEYALEANRWLPAGNEVFLSNSSADLNISFTEGDTIFNRWDCFKTLPYTTEDENSVVEVMSFMCESYKNTAGRYDKYKELSDYYFVNRSTLINVYNDAYENLDNIFTYQIPSSDELLTKKFPNYVVWSLPKNANDEIDTWTQMTLASILELDGDKGAVTSLNRLNNDLICFQELGISLILYNESVLIQSTTGVPIEIANSGKVLGKRYIDNIVGCSNKWSIAVGANGIYFVDDITKGIYQLGSKGLVEISDMLGFHSFINTYSVTTEPWNSKGNNRGCLTYYDKINGDVFFIWNTGICLCYSEALGQFMSFFPYKGPGFVNISDCSFWIAYSNNPNEIGLPIKIWEHNGGEYNMFYNYCEPYGLTIIANQNPTTDKIFDNIEFRSDSWNINEYELPILEQTTFDTLVTETEYQRGISLLSKKGYRLGERLYKEVVVLPWSTLAQMTASDSTASEDKVLYQAEEDITDPTHSLHFYTFRPSVSLNVVDVTSEVTSVSVNNPSTLKRKFRIWRALIPRNNSGTAVSTPSRDRMRNPWLTIHLYKYGAPLVGEFEWPPLAEEIPTVLPAGLDYGVEHKEKTVLHDIVVSYNE